ncbi:DUF2306 domain-containing protein [Nannocystis sp. ILAH1]|uniref:DUF2306 domain-containing protein n=1 Tax=unclassified Nannocystis TaxID=2627009 RepID=UPI002271B0F7|nr:DUF2306 domain-containing protein [Nannocystis sp. ILAH1]MCY1072298.1 DUF2306 domain-containing protein [Nannocystis sp. RBIL2]
MDDRAVRAQARSIDLETCLLKHVSWGTPEGAAERIGRLHVAYHSPFGPLAGASSLVLAPLWLTVTAIGVVQIRQRRVADHRRWMIRSFALTMSIVINRLVGVPIFVALYLLLGTSDEQTLQRIGAPIVAWSSWILAVVLVERCLRRESAGPPQSEKLAEPPPG